VCPSPPAVGLSELGHARQGGAGRIEAVDAVMAEIGLGEAALPRRVEPVGRVAEPQGPIRSADYVVGGVEAVAPVGLHQHLVVPVRSRAGEAAVAVLAMDEMAVAVDRVAVDERRRVDHHLDPPIRMPAENPPPLDIRPGQDPAGRPPDRPLAEHRLIVERDEPGRRRHHGSEAGILRLRRIDMRNRIGRPGRTQQVWHSGIRFLPGNGPAPGRHPVGTVLRFRAAPRAA
jgi:hypothetical protein